MLNKKYTKIKPAKNLSEQKPDGLQSPRTSPKIWKNIALLDTRYVYMHTYMYMFMYDIYIYNVYIYIYTFFHTYTCIWNICKCI